MMTPYIASLLAALRHQRAELDAMITDLEVSQVAECPTWPKRITLEARTSQMDAYVAALNLGLSEAAYTLFLSECQHMEFEAEVQENGTVRFLNTPRHLHRDEQAERER
jgi:hypothetical protein